MKERSLSSSQAKALDKKAGEKFAVPVLLLMENAGRRIMEETVKAIKGRPVEIAVFCGTGNNGGDGFCAARHLLTAGIRPRVYIAGRITDVKNEAGANLDILLKTGQKIIEISRANLPAVKKQAKQYSLIIDALLGVGLKGEVRPFYREIIEAVNATSAYIISVDIPSGLDATSGKVLGAAIKADRTVTFVAKKRGMLFEAGRRFCGEIVVSDIGIPL